MQTNFGPPQFDGRTVTRDVEGIIYVELPNIPELTKKIIHVLKDGSLKIPKRYTKTVGKLYTKLKSEDTYPFII